MSKALRLTARYPGKQGEEQVTSMFDMFLTNEDDVLGIDWVESDDDYFSALLEENIEYETLESIISFEPDAEKYVIIEEVEVDDDTVKVISSKHLFPGDLEIKDDVHENQQEETDDDHEYSQRNEITHLDSLKIEEEHELLIEDEIDELIPSSHEIIKELNPVITDIPLATSPWSIIAMSQQNSMIGMLYASMSKDFNNIDKSVLEDELLKFKNVVKNNSIYEVSQYLELKQELINHRKDINEQVETIRGSYDVNFKLWVEEKLEELKQHYMEDYPDTTEEQVQQLLLQVKPELDEEELQVENAKIYAEQALIREFSNFSKHPSLSAAMTFMTAKEQAREALRNSIPVLNSSSKLADDKQFDNSFESEEINDQRFAYTQDEDESQFRYDDSEDEDYQTKIVYEDDEEHNESNYRNEEQSVEAEDDVEQLNNILSMMTDEEIKQSYDLISEGVPLPDIIRMYKSGQLMDYQNTSYSDSYKSLDNLDTESQYQAEEDETHYQDEEVEEQTVQLEEHTPEISLPDTSLEDTINVSNVSIGDNYDDSEDEFEAQVREDQLDLGNTGKIPDITQYVDEEELPSDKYLKGGSDVLNSVEHSQFDEFTDGLNQHDSEDYDFGDSNESFDDDYISDDIELDETEDSSKSNKKDKKKKKKSDKDGKSTSKVKVAALSTAALLAVGGVGYTGYSLLNGSNSQSQQTKKSEKKDDNEAVLKFFDRAAKVGIDIDQAFSFTDEELGEVVGTITSLRSDGSITVTLDDGTQKTVPFSVVKAKVVSLESQAEESTEPTETAEPAENVENTEAAETTETTETTENQQ